MVTGEKAEQGDPEALYMIGQLYERGEGLPLRPDVAMKVYKMAAAKGHSGAMAKVRGNY